MISNGPLGKGLAKLKDGMKSFGAKATEGIGKKTDAITKGTDKIPPKGDGALKGLAKGLKAMGGKNVRKGIANLALTGLSFIAVLPGIPGMITTAAFGHIAGLGLIGLSAGLSKMGNKGARQGAINLLVTGAGFVAMTLGSVGMVLTAGLGHLAGLGLIGLSTGLSAIGTKQAKQGAMSLLLAGVGFAAMTLGVPGMIAISLLSVPVSTGMSILSTALTAFGTAAMNPLVWAGVGLLAALGLALIPMGFALGQAAPAISAFGDVVLSAFNGIASVITAVSTGFIDIMNSVTLEKIGTMMVLGPALLSVSAGLVALGLAAPFAMLAMIPLMLISALGSGLESASAGLSSVGTGIQSIMDSVSMEKIAGLFLLGPALLSASVGLVAFSLAMLAASVGDGISSLFGGGIMDTLSELSELSPKLVLVATALTAIGTSLGLMVTSLGNLNLDKLNELSDITIPTITIPEPDVPESIGEIVVPTKVEEITKPDIPESIGEVVVPTKVEEIPDTDIPESIGEVVVPTKVEEIPDTDIQASVAPDMTGIENAIPEGLTTTLSSISEMAPNLTLTAAALSEMGIALGLISTNLATIDTEKLTALSDFSISPSIGTAVTGIADSISGVIDSVSGVVGGETLSEYETQMMAKMDTLIAAVSTGRDVYMDKEKVTNVVMKMSERSSKNMFGLENA